MVRIHNIETDEIIDREMNDDEFAEYEAQVEVLANLKAEAETKATERQEILDRLGLTADEAKLLLG
jgi:hypothetical protein